MSDSTDRSMPLGGYFALSHGWTWACWAGAIVWSVRSAADVWESGAAMLLVLGGIGPMLGGIIMTRTTGGAAGLRELWRRTTSVRRVGARWWAVVLLLPPAAMAGGIALAALLGAATPIDVGTPLVDASQAQAAFAGLVPLLTFALLVLVLGPIPEEIGWRGYLLDAAQARWSGLTSSLIVGAAWAAWHIPLFLMPGYYAANGPPDPLLFTTAIMANSVLYTWIHNHTRRSVLAAIVFHFMVNFTGMLFEGSATVEWSRTALTAMVALWVIAGGRLAGLPRDRLAPHMDPAARGW